MIEFYVLTFCNNIFVPGFLNYCIFMLKNAEIKSNKQTNRFKKEGRHRGGSRGAGRTQVCTFHTPFRNILDLPLGRGGGGGGGG